MRGVRARARPLAESYPVVWVEAIYGKGCSWGRNISGAIMIACGVNAEGWRKVLAVGPRQMKAI